jgi:hypothetical protein
MPYKDPEAQKAHAKAYREMNREAARVYAKIYREANPEKMAEYKRDWRAAKGQKVITEERRMYHRERYRANREMYNARQREYRKAHPEKSYERQLKTRCGMSLAEKREMFELQKEKCKICLCKIEFLSSHVDHIHGSNPSVIRGLLCGPCNRAIGLFKDNPESLERAAAYLRPFQSIDRNEVSVCK